jgi:hypothetical protein
MHAVGSVLKIYGAILVDTSGDDRDLEPPEQPRIDLSPKQTLRLVQTSFANVNLIKAILGAAWAVTVP